MPRRGYRTITVREDAYERLRELAAVKGLSVSELIENFLLKDEESDEYRIDYIGWLGISFAGKINPMDNRPIVELDETDHIIFRCSKCATELVLAGISIERSGYGAIRLTFFCPKCGHAYYRKFYSPGPLGNVNEIPRVAAKTYGVDIYKKKRRVVEAMIISLGQEYYRTIINENSNAVCIDARILNSPIMSGTFSELNISDEFLRRYSALTGDRSITVINNLICINLKEFSRAFRDLVSLIVKGIRPTKTLSDGTKVYEFITDYELKPSQLLRYCRAYIVGGNIFVGIRGIDVLRSIRYVVEYVFDCLGCMELLNDDIGNCLSFSDVIDIVKEDTIKSCRHVQFTELVAASKVLPIFTTKGKYHEKVVIVLGQL